MKKWQEIPRPGWRLQKEEIPSSGWRLWKEVIPGVQMKAILSQMNAFMAGLRGVKEELTAQQLLASRSRQDQPHSLRCPGNINGSRGGSG